MKKNKVYSGLAGIVLGVSSLLSGCCARNGDTRVCWFPTISTTTYESDTSNKVKERKDYSISVFFFNIDIVVDNYGEDEKYLGRTKVEYRDVLSGNPKVKTKHYDKNWKLIKEEDGENLDMPSEVRSKIGISR